MTTCHHGVHAKVAGLLSLVGSGLCLLLCANALADESKTSDAARKDAPTVGSIDATRVTAGGQIFFVDVPLGRHRVRLSYPGAAREEAPAVGSIDATRVTTGGQIFVDGKFVGLTPTVITDVPLGRHRVRLSYPGSRWCQVSLTVRAKDVLNDADQGVELWECRRDNYFRDKMPVKSLALYTWSASALTPKRLAIDFGGGTPTFLIGRAALGLFSYSVMGGDLGIELRSNFYQNDALLSFRLSLVNAQDVWGQNMPALSWGIRLAGGGGGGPRGRNEAVFEAGMPLTLIIGQLFHVTFHPYAQYSSDQLCPTLGAVQRLAEQGQLAALAELATPEHPGDACTGRGPADTGVPPRNAIADSVGFDPNTGQLNPAVATYPGREHMVGGSPVLGRYTLWRVMLRGVFEMALAKQFNVWVLVEGNTLDLNKERQAYTNRFNRLFNFNDSRAYGMVGLTWKR